MTKNVTTLEMHISRGLPGSGKTTKLRSLAKVDGGRLVGRDHVRRLIGCEGLGSKSQEAEVTKLQETLIVNAFKAGQNVYVDDMNLKNAYVSRLWGIADRFGAEFIVHDLTDVSVDKAVRRNASRLEGQVPTSLIEDLHYRFVRGKPYPLPMPEKSKQFDGAPPKPYVPDPTKKWAVLIDIDGTVALHGTPDDPESIRKHHDYDNVHLDKPNNGVIYAVHSAIDSGYHPIFLSGRPDSCFSATATWLDKYVGPGGPFDYSLHMRRTGDGRPDYIVKNELFDKYIRDEYFIAYALDDRNQVVDMYREMGITVLQVAPGDF